MSKAVTRLCPICDQPFASKSETCSYVCGGVFRNKTKARRKYEKAIFPDEVPGARWIPLTQGKFVLVDADRYNELVAMGSWMYAKSGRKSDKPGYAVMRHKDRVPTITFLHRIVMRAKEGQEIDHHEHDTLDCRRSNLRFATVQQNNANRRKHGGSIRNFSSQYKGVTGPRPGSTRWTTTITVNDKTVRVGMFDTEIEAAQAYDRAAVKAFGRFAYLNFPVVTKKPLP